jgi:hypothetical protein
MKSGIFLFVGLILIGAGVLCFYVLGLDSTKVTINGVRSHDSGTRAILQWSVGGGIGALGLLFVVGGLRGRSRTKKQQAEIMHIMKTGIPVEGTVTFADKNYSFLVNKKPIYSIVEYTYVDQAGKQHTRRVETVPSDYVIRQQIQVGSKVNIKYATEDYGKSTILL